ncbi:hypothetical protein EC968_003693 [Mortierella alpina]|nr:hypothetical protein EC968_003693 [Mortierella alpina]
MAEPQQALVSYYSYWGEWKGEDIISSGACLLLSNPHWYILFIRPWSPSAFPPSSSSSSCVDHKLVLYNDLNCVGVNNEPASKTGSVFVASYFFKVPLSMRWTCIQPLPPSPPPPSKLPTTTTTSTLTTAIATLPSISRSGTVLSPSTATSTAAAIAGHPTPPRTPFPTALIPPNPMDSTADWGDHSCKTSDGGASSSSSDPACQTNPQVNHVIIAGVTISIIVLALMAAGTVYIYRVYYAPDHPTSSWMGSSAFRNGSSSHPGGSGSGPHSNSNSNTHSSSSNGGHRSGTVMDDHDEDVNPDYVYVHDESELERSGAPQQFMFDHRRDNINTNRNPKLFKENSASPSTSSRTRYSGTALTFANNGGASTNASDINLLERTR